MARVWAVVATYRRPDGLARLLRSLQAQDPAPAGVIVVDNGDDAMTPGVLTPAAFPVRVLHPGGNLGCGGGVARALEFGLAQTDATHFWQLDDDAAMEPGGLAALLAALTRAGADVAVPLIVDAGGRVSWFPGPLPHPEWRRIGREAFDPPAFRARFGHEPLTWEWSPWTSMLISRRAVEQVGGPRGDYWFQGEDIEYSLRLSARFRGVLVPGAVCVHHASAATGRPALLKKCALLQNNAYTFTRLPHGRRARRFLPGNFWRFLKEEGPGPAALTGALGAFWRGAVRGRPAGVRGFDTLRRQWERLATPAPTTSE